MAGLQRRSLTTEDIPAAVQLSREPGWNQTAEDWRFMIEGGDSFGCCTDAGRLVASGLTVPFGGRFGWISMILVTERYRRRGLATELMRACMDALLSKSMAPALDATPEGRQVYLRLGFEDVYRLTRFHAAAPRRIVASVPSGVTLRPIEESDMAELAAYDAPRFGADRRFLLEHLQVRLPGCALVAESGSRIRGYVLGRDGQTCSQIGPVVAEQEETAICLIAGALAASSGAVCIDVGNRHQALIDTLGASGFAPQFPFIRMIHERNEPFDDPARVFAIAGPELG